MNAPKKPLVSGKSKEELSQKVTVSEFLAKPITAVRDRLSNLGYIYITREGGKALYERDLNDPSVIIDFTILAKTPKIGQVEITASELLPLDTSSQTKIAFLEGLENKVRSIKKHLEDV